MFDAFLLFHCAMNHFETTADKLNDPQLINTCPDVAFYGTTVGTQQHRHL